MQMTGNKSGQSTIEYVLLLVVVAGFALSVTNNPFIKNMFSANSPFIKNMIGSIEYSFHYAGNGTIDVPITTNNHPTFYNIQNNNSRFFITTEKYGN